MKYENLTRFKDEEFKRLVGVLPRPLFLKMVSVLKQAELAKKKSGRPPYGGEGEYVTIQTNMTLSKILTNFI